MTLVQPSPFMKAGPAPEDDSSTQAHRSTLSLSAGEKNKRWEIVRPAHVWPYESSWDLITDSYFDSAVLKFSAKSFVESGRH
jgi:hypothetical protein